jgi:hypothetical protein
MIRLGPIEAYAVSHRRTMEVLGSVASLSLQAVNGSSNGTALRLLREGYTIAPCDLESIVPGLPDVQWEFKDGANSYELRTVTDDVVVTLTTDRSVEPSPFLAEGRLRGLAARLVVTMTHP